MSKLSERQSRVALGKIMAQAKASGLLGVVERPNPREIAGRARAAAADFLQLHPLPKDPIN